MSGDKGAKDAGEAQRVADVVQRWREDPEQPLYCPRCGLEGLCVIDRSARPYSEWFVVSCAGCSLEATLNIPLAPPSI